MVIASSTASRPNSVVNLMIGFMATDDVSLNGSPTVSPTTVAACSGVFLALSSVSTTFFALSQAPPALAMKIAWYRPNSAIEIRYPMKKYGSRHANASVEKKTTMKMLNMPRCAYSVQISTTFLESSIDAFSALPSSLMFALMNSTARYAPVDTACVDAPVNQYTTAPPATRPSRNGGWSIDRLVMSSGWRPWVTSTISAKIIVVAPTTAVPMST